MNDLASLEPNDEEGEAWLKREVVELAEIASPDSAGQ